MTWKEHPVTKGLDGLNIFSDIAVIYGFLKLFFTCWPKTWQSHIAQGHSQTKKLVLPLQNLYSPNTEIHLISPFSQWDWSGKIELKSNGNLLSSHTHMLHLLNSQIFWRNILLIIYYSCLASVLLYWCTAMPAWLRVGIHFGWYLETELEVT